MGIRLDGGTAYSGAVITRYYDSLLDKVTAWAPTPERRLPAWTARCANSVSVACRTNIAFVENLLKHPTFLTTRIPHQVHRPDAGAVRLSKAPRPRTKVLTYIADITVNGHPETKAAPPCRTVRAPRPPRQAEPTMGTRNLLEHKGPQAVADWMQSKSNC